MIACYGQDHEMLSQRRRMGLMVSSGMKEDDE